MGSARDGVRRTRMLAAVCRKQKRICFLRCSKQLSFKYIQYIIYYKKHLYFVAVCAIIFKAQLSAAAAFVPSKNILKNPEKVLAFPVFFIYNIF